MSRKDYQILAFGLHAARPDEESRERTGEGQWRRAINMVANHLQRDNFRFDHQRFITACETGKD